MSIYYKFKSAKAFDSLTIEGQFISVGNLKERIFESKHLGSGTDFDVMISNAQSNEEYVDEAAMIPKNTSVLIRRVPGQRRMRIITAQDERKSVDYMAEAVPPQSSMLVDDSSATIKYPEESEGDEFGNDLYAIPELVPTQSVNRVVEISPASKNDEENKIKALIETPALDWSCQGQDGYGGGRGFGRGINGRLMAGLGFGRGGFERKTPPAGYICYRCKIPGHFIQNCSTNGDPNYDIRKVKPPTGIPKSMLILTPDGSYSLPSGAAAVLRPNEAAFEREIEGLPSTRPVSDVPPELRCPLCKEVMKDAVLTGKCCFRSFCDKCIRDYIISKSMCVCGATNILADDLLPNKTLRETISRILESATSSTEKIESMVLVQDTESARHTLPKIPSPTLSVASKDESKQTPVDHSLDVKVGDANVANATNEGKAVNDTVHSMEKNNMKGKDPSEATPESFSGKVPISPVSAAVPDVQEKLLGGEQGKKKRKKKALLPGSAADMQWSGFQDIGDENYGRMPLGPSAYNPYCGGGVPMGMDAYMAPFGTAMPFMGYTPGPFDVSFGGMLPPDPYLAPGYMMPPFPSRDLAGLRFNSMSMNYGPPMSREEFEAMKVDIRRKHELERGRHNERDRCRDGRGFGREGNRSGADVSPMKSKLISSPSLSTTLHHHRRDHSPPAPSKKRRSSPAHEDEATATTDRSLFSRISFHSDSLDREIKKKRRLPSTSHAAAPDNAGAIKDRHHHHHHRYESNATTTTNGYRMSEDEEEEEEYHFKRRPSSSKRDSRERDRGNMGRHESKRR